MRHFTFGLFLAALLFAGTPVIQAHPPANIQRMPSVSSVPAANSGVGGYGYGVPYGGYGATTYVSPYGTGYRSSFYYTTPFGYGAYNNTGVTATPFGYNYYRNSGYQVAPGLGGGYSTGTTVTPWYSRTYGYGY